jgi:hypothetical protein
VDSGLRLSEECKPGTVHSDNRVRVNYILVHDTMESGNNRPVVNNAISRNFKAAPQLHYFKLLHFRVLMSSTIQRFCYILLNAEVHYRAHKSPSLIPVQSQMNPVHSTPSYLRSILILSTHLRLYLRSGLFPSGIHTKIRYVYFFLPISATCPAH